MSIDPNNPGGNFQDHLMNRFQDQHPDISSYSQQMSPEEEFQAAQEDVTSAELKGILKACAFGKTLAPTGPSQPLSPGVRNFYVGDNMNGDAESTWPSFFDNKTTDQPPEPDPPPGPPPMDLSSYPYPVKVSGSFDNTNYETHTVTINFEVETSYYYNYTFSYSATLGSGEGFQEDPDSPISGNWHISSNMSTLKKINPRLYNDMMATQTYHIVQQSYKETQKITQQEQDEYSDG